jgi:dTDP-4-dehydrorhamnose reductase
MTLKTENKKILILGCGGMLGQAVYHTLKPNNQVLATDIDLNEPWLEYLDIRDIESIFKTCRSFSPDLIINLAAYTDLEFCEGNKEEAYLVNALGQDNICLVAAKYDIPVVYISSAGIFDGSQEYYNDFEVGHPLSIYGKSKYYGELQTINTLKKYFVFRAGWMMGGLMKDKKFIKKIYDQITAGKKELFIVADKFGTPTYTWDLARSMDKIISTEYYGLYNIVCEGDCSRFDLAKEFISDLNLSDQIKINVVPSDYFEREYYAPRPASEKLTNQKLKARNLLFMRDWRVCLKEYSEEFLKLSRQ